MICGLCAEKAACETCCLLLTCWAESVHPQGTGACGSRLAGSIRHPGTHRVLLSLPKAAQQFMSSLLAAVQERSLGKELHSFEMRIKHSSGASWSKGIYAHDKGEEVAQLTWQRTGEVPQSALLSLPWCTRSTDLPPQKRGGHSWDNFSWPFQSSPQARDARLEKSNLPNDFLMFVSAGEISHAFNLLQKKSGNEKGFMIFKCSNIYFGVSVFITIMLVTKEISQDQELMFAFSH